MKSGDQHVCYKLSGLKKTIKILGEFYRNAHWSWSCALRESESVMYRIVLWDCYLFFRGRAGNWVKCPSLPFKSLLRREEKPFRHFPMVTKFQNFVQRRLRNVQKSMMHVQSCCFTNINLLLFNCSRCCRPRCCLKSLLLWYRYFATMVTWNHTSPFYRRVVLNSFPFPSSHPQSYHPLFSHR